jgi:hypothetical protein
VSLRSRDEEILAYCKKLEETIERIKQGAVNQNRFEDAKGLVLKEFKDSLREPYKQLYQLLGTDLFELGLNYIPTFSLRLERVSPAVLQNVVETHFKHGGTVVVVAGSARQLESALSEIGPVQLLN